MTREQAEELVMDLIIAYHDYETCSSWSRKSYREDYYDTREKVVVALCTVSRPHQPAPESK